MKTVLNLSYLIIMILLLSSCYSSKMLVDDDVYVVKNNTLPVGESLTDETSYSTYKNKKNNNKSNNTYYQNQNNYLYNRHCNYFDGFGCSYYASNFYSPYYNPYGYYGNGFYGGNSMYNTNGVWILDPYTGLFFYRPSFYSAYGNYPYGYNVGGIYGSPYYPYDYGYYNNVAGNYSYSTPEIHSNQHSGPRGSISGFGNPAGRNKNNIVLKSASVPSGNQKPNTSVVILKDRPVGRPVERNVNNPNTQTRQTIERPERVVPNTYRPSGVRVTSPTNSNQRQGRPPVVNPRGGQNRQPVQNREVNPPSRNNEAPTNRGGNNPRGGGSKPPERRHN